MSFAVVWSQSAAHDIDQAWALAPEDDQQQLERVIGIVDAKLRDSPDSVGESRYREDVRVYIHPPLTVLFHVQHRLRVVRVLSARVFRSH